MIVISFLTSSVCSGLVLIFLLIFACLPGYPVFSFPFSIIFIILLGATVVAIWKNKARMMLNWRRLATRLN